MRIVAHAARSKGPGLRTKIWPAVGGATKETSQQRRDINATDAPAPAGQYTQAVEVTGASGTLYLSGQVGIAADGSIPEDAEAQCALAWRNLQAQLRAAGMEIRNLVKITTIVRDPARCVPAAPQYWALIGLRAR